MREWVKGECVRVVGEGVGEGVGERGGGEGGG